MSDLPPNALVQTGYIIPSSPFVDPKTGIITTIWWRFLIALLTRTGGSSGIIIDDVELLTLLSTVQQETEVAADVAALGGDGDGDGDDTAPVASEALALAVQRLIDGGVEPADIEALTALYAPQPEIPVADDLAGLLMPLGDTAAVADGFEWNVGTAATVVGDTYTLKGYAAFSGSFTALQAIVGPGGVGVLTETLAINGVAVTGISAVTVNSATVQTFAATGAQTFVVGDKITLVVVVSSGVPVGAWSSALYTRT